MEGSRTLYPSRRERIIFFAEQEYTKDDGTIGNRLHHYQSLMIFPKTRGPAVDPAPAASAGGNHRRHGRKQPCPAGHFRPAPQGRCRHSMSETATIFVRNGWMKPLPSAPSPGAGPCRIRYGGQRLLPAGVCGPSTARPMCGAEIRLDTSAFQFDKVCKAVRK